MLVQFIYLLNIMIFKRPAQNVVVYNTILGKRDGEKGSKIRDHKIKKKLFVILNVYRLQPETRYCINFTIC